MWRNVITSPYDLVLFHVHFSNSSNVEIAPAQIVIIVRNPYRTSNRINLIAKIQCVWVRLLSSYTSNKPKVPSPHSPSLTTAGRTTAIHPRFPKAGWPVFCCKYIVGDCFTDNGRYCGVGGCKLSLFYHQFPWKSLLWIFFMKTCYFYCCKSVVTVSNLHNLAA